MKLETRKKVEPIVSWILAMLLCPLGVCFAAKSGLGVSMIEAPVYVLHLKLSQFWPWYSFGMSEYVVQALLLIVLCIVTRQAKWKYLLSFVTAFVYGWILDGWNYLLASMTAETLVMQILFAVIGCVGVAFAVAMFFRTWLPLEVWELFVKELAEKFHWNIAKVKWCYDISSLTVGVILLLIFFGTSRWDAIGIGTIVTTFINAPIIALSTKIQDKLWDGLTKQ